MEERTAFNRHHGRFMNINRLRIRVAASSIAIALLLQIAPVKAEPKPDRNGPVDISFTKWVTTRVTVVDGFGLGIQEGRSLMAGTTGGAVPDGTFVGEVLQRQPSANPGLKAGIVRLEAIYEVHDAYGEHVFTALIRGGANAATGAALLDGVVLAGWRTGAAVHVEFQTMPGCSPTGGNCFEGTIHVGPGSKGND